jgi:DNA excision repair protein ERCC-4
MHFPKLRVLWCPSPYASAELFEDLKVENLLFNLSRFLFSFQRDREEPDSKNAMLVTAESELLNDDERYNSVVQVLFIFLYLF